MAKQVPDWKNLGEFVQEGLTVALPLCFPGQSVPPPAHTPAINCMAIDRRRTVYLGMGGKSARLMAGMIHQDSGVVLKMGQIEGATDIIAVEATSRGVELISVGPDRAALWRTRQWSKSFLIQEWSTHPPAIEHVADLDIDTSQPIRTIALDDNRLFLTVGDAAYLLQLVTGHLQPLEGEANNRGALACDAAGNVWGSTGNARLWCWPNGSQTVQLTDHPIPAGAGRAQHTHVSAWTLAHDGTLYGGTYPDGFLFRLDPVTGQTSPLGKPTRTAPITCLTTGNDGRIFGMCGDSEDPAHLFVHDPADGSLRDLGMPVGVIGERQYGYHFACCATGRDGEIYFGQHERVNHLWVYFPAVPRRPMPATTD